jgi:aldehyde:ferredoxin oxidoreductase
MALAYGTSSIGAHHKDAWVISWEVETGRERYDAKKVDKVIELQRIRGGIFECLAVCRFPWIEVGLELEWYPRLLHAATGLEFSVETLYVIADRVFNLTRAFWVREFGSKWTRDMDVPPVRWFEEPLKKGPLRRKKLSRSKYDTMLQMYYRRRGWDYRGVPTKSTLKRLGLGEVAGQLRHRVELSD